MLSYVDCGKNLDAPVSNPEKSLSFCHSVPCSLRSNQATKTPTLRAQASMQWVRIPLLHHYKQNVGFVGMMILLNLRFSKDFGLLKFGNAARVIGLF